MIASLHGTVLSTGADQIVLEVGGVGFAVAVPSDVVHTARPAERMLLHTHLVVREDVLALYGFATPDELAVFGHLITVTGVGPKSALGVLSHLTVDQIATAVADEDDAPFRRVSGIGPKTAKLIIMQLAGKLAVPPTAAGLKNAPAGVIDQVTAALVGLGWTEKVAAEAAERSAEAASEAERATVATLLRRALADLGPATAGVSRG